MSEELINEISSRLGDAITGVFPRSPRRLYLEVKRHRLREAATVLFREMGARYAIASATQLEDGFEVLHHFAFDAQHIVVSLRVKADGQKPELDSLAPVIKGAGFIEREMHDLLGIDFRGHPGLKRLILSDDWPEGVYPLRRGKPWEGKVRKPI